MNIVDQIFYKRKNISLKKFIALAWVIYGFVIKKEKYTFTLDELTIFISETSISQEELKSFLSMISLDNESFKDKYITFRKKDDGSYFTYEERMSFDRGLPKISFFFPLLNIENGYRFISYNSYHEFMKMRSVYRIMTEEFV